MKIDVILTPAEIDHLAESNLSQTTCVVFDVLRATSSFVTAFAGGAVEVHPVETIEEAVDLKTRIPNALLGGERNGDRIEGFDLGNSPLEYRSVHRRTIISTTTNGTVALRACAAARETLAGALLNLDAIISHLRTTAPEHVLLVCAGTFREMALEDVLAAGAVVDALETARHRDAARVARATFQESGQDLLAALKSSRNGRALLTKDRGDDIRWCAQPSIYDVVPHLDGGVLRVKTE